MKRTIMMMALAAFALATPAPALAGGGNSAAKRQADGHARRGVTLYNLGRFDEAIAAFEDAYQAFPSASLLFNIAQAHRQLGNCERAIFFYRRFLSESGTTPYRAEVEARITDLEAACTLKTKPPAAPISPGGDGAESDGAAAGSDASSLSGYRTEAGDAPPPTEASAATEVAASEEDEAEPAQEADPPASSVAATASGRRPPILWAALGPGVLLLGEVAAANGGVVVGGSLPIGRAPAELSAGLGLGLAALPWRDRGNTGTIGLTDLHAIVSIGAAVPPLRLRAEAGVGMLLLSGLAGPRNLLVDRDARAGNWMMLLDVRVGGAIAYPLSPRLSVIGTAGVAVAPAIETLRGDAVVRLQAAIGLGWSP
jgi:tetratricopeptide repeat protein